jgi:hypothetical protein
MRAAMQRKPRGRMPVQFILSLHWQSPPRVAYSGFQDVPFLSALSRLNHSHAGYVVVFRAGSVSFGTNCAPSCASAESWCCAAGSAKSARPRPCRIATDRAATTITHVG